MKDTYTDEEKAKMIREVEEEVEQLKEYFDYLEEDDYEELSDSLSRMFTVGFNYAKRKFANSKEDSE